MNSNASSQTSVVTDPGQVAAVLRLGPRYDSLVAEHGHDAHSPGFARLWTPLLGPAAAALYRSLADLVNEADTSTVDVLSLGASIGVGARKAPRTVREGLKRLAFHDLVAERDLTLVIRTHAPTPPRVKLDSVPLPWRILST